LLKDVGALFTMNESTTEGQLFGLASPELTSIKPNYEAMIKNGHLRATEMGLQHVGEHLIVMFYFLIPDYLNFSNIVVHIESIKYCQSYLCLYITCVHVLI